MNCPKCGKTSKSDFCIYSGYKEDGTYIKNKPAEETLLELYFDEDFEKFSFNKNWILSFLLGPLFFIRYKVILPGILFTIIDSLCNFFILEISTMTLTSGFTILVRLFYFIFERLLWCTMNNILLTYFIEKKLERIKIENPDNYKSIIFEKSNHRTISYFFIIFIFILLLILRICFHNIFFI